MQVSSIHPVHHPCLKLNVVVKPEARIRSAGRRPGTHVRRHVHSAVLILILNDRSRTRLKCVVRRRRRTRLLHPIQPEPVNSVQCPIIPMRMMIIMFFVLSLSLLTAQCYRSRLRLVHDG